MLRYIVLGTFIFVGLLGSLVHVFTFFDKRIDSVSAIAFFIFLGYLVLALGIWRNFKWIYLISLSYSTILSIILWFWLDKAFGWRPDAAFFPAVALVYPIILVTSLVALPLFFLNTYQKNGTTTGIVKPKDQSSKSGVTLLVVSVAIILAIGLYFYLFINI